RLPPLAVHERMPGGDEGLAAVQRIQLPGAQQRSLDVDHVIDLTLPSQHLITYPDLLDRLLRAIRHRHSRSRDEATEEAIGASGEAHRHRIEAVAKSRPTDRAGAAVRAAGTAHWGLGYTHAQIPLIDGLHAQAAVRAERGYIAG